MLNWEWWERRQRSSDHETGEFTNMFTMFSNLSSNFFARSSKIFCLFDLFSAEISAKDSNVAPTLFWFRFNSCSFSQFWNKTKLGLFIRTSHDWGRSLPQMKQFNFWTDKQRTPLGMGINLGSISSSLPIFHVILFGFSWNRSAECPYLRVQRKSCDLDSALKMLDSVLLKTWENFLVTLPSNSSETCVLCTLQWF